MKRIILSLLLIVLLLSVVACSFNKTQDTETGEYISNQVDTGCQIIGITEETVQGALRANIKHSSFVVEGTLASMEPLQVWPGRFYNRDTADGVTTCTFTDLEMITGYYPDSTLSLQIGMSSPDYANWEGYQIGRRYILVVCHNDAVNRPQEEIYYMDYGVHCVLDEKDPERISELVVMGCPMTDMVNTRTAFIEIVKEQIGITNTYYNPLDQYVHSDQIADIVQGSAFVAKVRMEKIKEFSDVFDQCTCYCQKVFKGEITNRDGEKFNLLVLPDSAEENEEYLVLFQTIFQTNQVAAKKNCVIPMTDTERVNEVYAALGIEPEE